jgi:hypothetical protein
MECRLTEYNFIISKKLSAPVVWWSELLATDPEVLVSVPGSTRFFERWWFWNGGLLSPMGIIEELLE